MCCVLAQQLEDAYKIREGGRHELHDDQKLCCARQHYGCKVLGDIWRAALGQH